MSDSLQFSSEDYDRIGQAIDWLEYHDLRDDEVTLTALAGHVGLSPTHLQKLFTRWVGVSPKRFLGAVRMNRARAALDDAASVLEAALDAGLSGPGRLHDLFIAHDGVSPGAHKDKGAGLTIHYGSVDSPFGRAFLAATEKGLCHLSFIDEAKAGPSRGEGGGIGDEAAQLAALKKRWSKADLVEAPDQLDDLAARAFAPATGRNMPLPLHLNGTNFQVKVWQALLAIPEGATVTYSEVARAVGNEGATRAVASAVSRNPIAFIIPCHRVLRKSGAMGGYYFGLTRKRVMLDWEAWQAEAQGRKAA